MVTNRYPWVSSMGSHAAAVDPGVSLVGAELVRLRHPAAQRDRRIPPRSGERRGGVGGSAGTSRPSLGSASCSGGTGRRPQKTARGPTGTGAEGAGDEQRASAERRGDGGRAEGATGATSEVDDRTGQRPGDPVDALHPGDHELAQLVDALRLGTHDDVIGSRDVLGHRDALDERDLACDVGGLADLGLNEDVRLHHHGGASQETMSGGEPIATARSRRMTTPVQGSVGALGEFGLIAAVTARLPQGRGVLLGPGDDAAVVAAPDGRVVVTTDVLVEGRHFRRDWSSATDVGHKAAAQSLADIAAMGARPTVLVVGLATPADLPVAWAVELADGLREECSTVGASVVGGDVVRADSVVVSVTALGDLEGREPVTRPVPGPATRWPSPVGWAGRPRGWRCSSAAFGRRASWPTPTAARNRRTRRGSRPRWPEPTRCRT